MWKCVNVAMRSGMEWQCGVEWSGNVESNGVAMGMCERRKHCENCGNANLGLSCMQSFVIQIQIIFYLQKKY